MSFYKKKLQFMSLFILNLIEVYYYYFTNDEDIITEWTQHSNLLLEKVTWHTIVSFIVNFNVKYGVRSNFLQKIKKLAITPLKN